MHLAHIFQDHEPHFAYTKGGKRKYPEKAKLVLKASQLYYQAMADKKDPRKINVFILGFVLFFVPNSFQFTRLHWLQALVLHLLRTWTGRPSTWR
jgi:hypothetical protein